MPACRWQVLPACLLACCRCSSCGCCRLYIALQKTFSLCEFIFSTLTASCPPALQRVDQLQCKHTAVASQRFWNEYGAWQAAQGVKPRKGGVKGGNSANPV